MEWDDDEMATQIYDKAEMAEVSKGLAIDTSGLGATAQPVPARGGSAVRPQAQAAARRSSKTPVIAAAILIVAVIVTVLIIVFGKDKGEAGKQPVADAAVPVLAAADTGGAVLPAGDAGTAAPAADAAAVAPTADAAVPVKTTTVNVLLADGLKTAKLTLDGVEIPWKRVLDVPVPEGGSVVLAVDWPGKQCKETQEGGCPQWKITAASGDLEVTADAFTAAPIRLALQGTLLEGAALFEKLAGSGSSEPTYQGLTIQVEGNASYASLLPGTHTLVVRKEGYPDFELPAVTVPEDPTQAPAIPIPLLVALEVTSRPQSARVLLARGSDEPAEIGETGGDPVRVLVDRSQSYRIKVAKNGYRAFEQALTFEEGRATLALAPELQRESGGGHVVRPPPPPGGGKLTVITQPWTMVYVNGRRVKQTPLLNHELSPGRYQLTLLNQEAGIRHTEMVIIQDGRTTMIRRTQDQLR